MSDDRPDPGTAEATGSGTGAGAGTADGWLSQLWLDVANRYERFQYLEEEDKERLDWHGWGSILTHWSMVLTTLLAAATGIAIWTGLYGPLEIGIWGGYHVAFLTHTWAGVLLAVIAFLLYPSYALWADGESPLISVEQVQEQIVIALAFLGLANYIPGYKKARRTYDATADEWAGYHPAQTAFWYATWLFVGVLTLTGFALWAELATDPAWWIGGLGFLGGVFSYETLLRVHLLSTILFLVSVAVHAYFPLSPDNHDLLFSMIHGTLDGWVVDEETRPESRGEARTKDKLPPKLGWISKRLGTSPDLEERVGEQGDGSDENGGSSGR